MSNQNGELTQDSLGYQNGGSGERSVSTNGHSHSNGLSNGNRPADPKNDNDSRGENRAYIPPHLRKQILSTSTGRANNGRWADDEEDRPRGGNSARGRESGDWEDDRDRRPQERDRLSRSDSYVPTARSRPIGNNRWNDSAAEPSPFASRDDTSPRIKDVELLKDEELFQTMNTGINFDKYDDIPVEASGQDCPAPLAMFSDANLGSIINRNIELSGYDKPTPIQKHAIPIVSAHRDLMACAQTGSGKTAAFLLPVISLLLKNPPPPSQPSRYGNRRSVARPSALVLAPTRELASQIYLEARKFAYKSSLKCVVVYGGADIYNQLRDLERGVDILVATPGRLVDLMERGRVALDCIQFLTLDEADRMLDMGFEPQIRKIVEEEDMPPVRERQTLMFSATFPEEIQRLASDFLYDWIFLRVGRVGSTTDFISQKVMFVQENEKRMTVVGLLKEVKGLTLVFVQTKRGADALEDYLYREGFPAASIHGDRTQKERESALANFRSGRVPILVATDVAARGLDIPNVLHVINYDMPNNIDDYVHRIGRTGRAGNSGLTTGFICDDDAALMGDLMDLLKESDQEIPDWFDNLCRSSRFGRSRGGGGRKGGNRFGGRDYRSPGGGGSGRRPGGLSGGWGGSSSDGGNYGGSYSRGGGGGGGGRESAW